MKCKYIEKEQKRIIKILLITLLLITATLILILAIMFRKYIFTKISWESLGVIIACITLIVSMVYNHNEKKRSILITKKVREQEKFEQEIDKILEFYPSMLEDYIINTNLKLREPYLEAPVHFDIETLDLINALNTKYICDLIAIDNKVDYLYKFHAENHPEYDKFKIKINGMNQILKNEINNFSNLLNECLNNGDGFSFEVAQNKVEKRTIYTNNIKDVFINNINELYVLANNCIEERNKLSVK